MPEIAIEECEGRWVPGEDWQGGDEGVGKVIAKSRTLLIIPCRNIAQVCLNLGQ